MKDTFRIGEIAGKIGVQPESIRYYERIGLLPKTTRGAGRYRVFTREHLERVELIKKMQALGFSLDQIRRMLELKFTHGHSCQHVRAGLHEKLEEIDRQIADLKAFRNEIARALKTCERSLEIHPSSDYCPVLDSGVTST